MGQFAAVSIIAGLATLGYLAYDAYRCYLHNAHISPAIGVADAFSKTFTKAGFPSSDAGEVEAWRRGFFDLPLVASAAYEQRSPSRASWTLRYRSDDPCVGGSTWVFDLEIAGAEEVRSNCAGGTLAARYRPAACRLGSNGN